MAIRFTCPACRTLCSVGEEHRGKTVFCPACKKALVAPSGAVAPPKAPERPAAPKPPPPPAVRVHPPAAPLRLPSPKPRAVPARAVVARPTASPPRRVATVGVQVAPASLSDRVAAGVPFLKRMLTGRLKLLILAGVGFGGLALCTLAVGVLFLVFWRSSGQSGEAPVAKAELPPRAEVPAGPTPTKIEPATVRKVKDATAYLRVRLPNGAIGEGSGFFCLEPGVVMTNAHVLGMLLPDAPPPKEVDVVLHSGEANEEKLTGTVLAVDRTNDLAVLRVPGDASRLPSPLPVDSAEKLVETQNVYIFGFPLGAELGKNITVSESSVSSLRRDGSGALHLLQVNGGIHQGNSGGPVTDARGAVVGVSVSIIRGTQINFAVPADFVTRLLDGKCDATELGTPYRAESSVMLPVKLNCLDPLGRVRDMKVEVWVGSPGNPRPAALQAPEAKPGDGPRRTYPLVRADGAFKADVPMPARQPGQVCWLRPVFFNAVGVRQWDVATAVPEEAQVVLERQPASIQFKPPTAAIERTVELNSVVTLNVYRGQNRAAVLTQKMESTALESLHPDPRGIGTFIRLTIGKCDFRREAGSETLTPPAKANAQFTQYSPTFLVDATHACKERGLRNFRRLPPDTRGVVELMYESLCNTFEATTLPVSNRVMRPGETWPAQVPLFVIREGRRQVLDLHLMCTYDGLRVAEGRNEASISLAGEAKSRGLRATVLGKVKGKALLDVDRGFVTLVKLSVNSEVDDEDKGLRVLVSEESTITRTEGNTQGIVAARVNQPGG